MKNLKKNVQKLHFPFSPILFACAFVLAQLKAWFNEVYIQSVILPLGVVIVGVLILFYLFRLIFKNSVKTEIFTSSFLILFFSFRAIANLSWNFFFSVGKVAVGKDAFQIIVCIAILGLIFFKLHKSKKDPEFFRILFFRISLIAFAISLLLVSVMQVQRMILPPVKSPLVLPKTTLGQFDKNKLPDIYFIEPEDNASPAVFKNYFNYDETEFTSFLNKSGFYIATEATSNYPKTFLSLASMLNMEYLDYLSKYKNSSDLTLVNPLIDNNNVLKYLKKFGYKYYQMGSWWGPTQYDAVADDNFTIETEGRISIDSFLYNLADSTALSPILKNIIPVEAIGDSDDDDRQRLVYQFNKLPQTVNITGPKFVFAHIIAPHRPYVFGKDCEVVDEELTSQKTEIENYVNQTDCINKKLESVITTIIASSKNPPVIIILTDEGAPFLNGELTPIDNWKTANGALLREKFPILAAFYLPGVSTEMFNQNMTPVNVFRTVFDVYFNAGLTQLPDKNFIFQDLNNLYQFTDVTDKIKGSN